MRYTIVSFFIACASCGHIQTNTDNVAENIMYHIGPVSEGSREWNSAQKVAQCVALKSKRSLDAQSYSEFESELAAHAEDVVKYVSDLSTNQNGVLLERSTELNEKFDSLMPSIISCEEKIGVNIEF